MSEPDDGRAWFDPPSGHANDVPTLGNTPTVSHTTPTTVSPSGGHVPPGVGGVPGSIPPVGGGTPPIDPSAGRPGRSSTSPTLWLVFGILGTLVMVALVAVVFLLVRSSDSDTTVTATDELPEESESKSTRTTDSVAAETLPSTTIKPAKPLPSTPTASAPAVQEPSPSFNESQFGPVGDVRTLADGLFCRDLKARGYSYSAAVDYWRVHGQPDRMDADKNGIPCETVYPRSDVTAYWPSASYQSVPYYGLPSGLLCRDLASRGINVYGALLYYIWEGFPERMDADKNGIPCETVYPNARQVWLNEF